MTQPITLPGAGAPSASVETASNATSVTRALLACGVVAGPLYVVVSLLQALTREGFDLTRHAWSLLSNGDLGWIQITNFVVTGLLTVACALGMRRTVRGHLAGTWGPLLIGVYGVSLIAAGAFVADPMDGFPAGTPAGPPAAISWHGVAHLVAGGIGFLALIAACFVFARRFAAGGERGWMAYSVVTGVVFFAAFLGIASGSSNPLIVLAFVAAVLLAWSWIAAVSAWLMKASVSIPGRRW
ncbi:MAG: DUF998 domain-containing protein [Chloroflexota bacterium]